MIDSLGISCETIPRWRSLVLTDKANIGSDNGLLVSGNKILPEPMLTNFYDTYGVTRPQWVDIVKITKTIIVSTVKERWS